MKDHFCENLKQLNKIAKELLKVHNNAKIFAFYGNMGVGKTTFIKEICKCLDVNDNVLSPTFSIINQYTTIQNDFIYHFDFYRIKNINEVYDLGYEDYFYSNSVCLIEWPELIKQLLPNDTVSISINQTEGYSRIITF